MQQLVKKKSTLDAPVTTTTKSLLPPLFNSFNERKAYFKNLHEQIRLEKLLDHLDVQERAYLQLFRKEKQVVEMRRRRTLAVQVKSHSCLLASTTTSTYRASAAAETRLRSVSLLENSSQFRATDSLPVQPLAKQASRLHHKLRPLDDEEQRRHLQLLLPPDDTSTCSAVDLPDEKDRSTGKHQTSQLHLTERESTKFCGTDGLSDLSNKHVTLDPVPDNTLAVAPVFSAAALLRRVSASGRLVTATSAVNNMLSTTSSDNYPRCNSAAANLFTAPSKSLAIQKAVHEKQRESLTMKSERTSSTQLSNKSVQKIVHRRATAEIPTCGRMNKAEAKRSCRKDGCTRHGRPRREKGGDVRKRVCRYH